MYYDVGLTTEEKAKYPTEMKIICAGPQEKVVGLHSNNLLGGSRVNSNTVIKVHLGGTHLDRNTESLKHRLNTRLK
jgi:glutathione reductase (NADPH)